MAELRARYPQGSGTYCTKNITCYSPAVGALKAKIFFSVLWTDGYHCFGAAALQQSLSLSTLRCSSCMSQPPPKHSPCTHALSSLTLLWPDALSLSRPQPFGKLRLFQTFKKLTILSIQPVHGNDALNSGQPHSFGLANPHRFSAPSRPIRMNLKAKTSNTLIWDQFWV